MTTLEAHPHALLFPMATEAELAEMAADIKQRGLLVPIVMFEGKVLDGRCRFEACRRAGVKPTFTEYAGKDALGDVVSWNLHRRHLTTSQQATLAVRLKPACEERARERMQVRKGDQPGASKANLPDLSKGQSRDEAARMVGVSGRLVQDAEKVQELAPAKFAEVEAGTKTVGAAMREIKAEHKEDDAETTEPDGEQEDKPKDAPARRPGKAMEYAAEAINVLRKIKKNDSARHEAFATVKKWVTDNE